MSELSQVLTSPSVTAVLALGSGLTLMFVMLRESRLRPNAWHMSEMFAGGILSPFIVTLVAAGQIWTGEYVWRVATAGEPNIMEVSVTAGLALAFTVVLILIRRVTPSEPPQSNVVGIPSGNRTTDNKQPDPQLPRAA